MESDEDIDSVADLKEDQMTTNPQEQSILDSISLKKNRSALQNNLT